MIPGWIDDPQSVADIARLQPFEGFADTPAGNADAPAQVFGWQVYQRVTGREWPARNQGSVGSCVSFGTAAAIEYTMVCEISRSEPEGYVELAQEVIYAGSRVEVGNGRIQGDGSVGAWAAEFVRTWGVLPREIVGEYDLRQYDEVRCRLWGRIGVPDQIEPMARLHPVRAVTRVKTVQEARRALASGYGIAVCSNQGFTFERDREGFCRATGRWAHCMAIIGYQTGNRPGMFIVNSWGPHKHTGPVGAGNPPTCGFYADDAVVEAMLGAGDSWTFGDLLGFPSKQLSWVL